MFFLKPLCRGNLLTGMDTGLIFFPLILIKAGFFDDAAVYFFHCIGYHWRIGMGKYVVKYFFFPFRLKYLFSNL